MKGENEKWFQLLFPKCNNIYSSGATISYRLFSEKWFLIPIWINKRKRWYFAQKLRNCFTLVLYLTTFSLKNSVSKTSCADIRCKAEIRWAHKKYHPKISKTISLLGRFQSILPRSSLLSMYKAFIRSQLDYADVMYNQAYNSSFHEKLESL